MSKSSVTRQLARFVRELVDTDLDGALIRRAKMCLMDTLGAALAGVRTVESQAMLGALDAIHGDGITPVWGTEIRTGASGAALVNGTLAHAWEADDFGSFGHPGAVVIPASLATAELGTVSGETLIAAIVAGYEVGFRIVSALGGYARHNEMGWHSTGTCGGFAAAGAAACVLRLDEDRTVHSLGIAGTYAGGVWAFQTNGSMCKRLHAGKAAQAGVEAALLARSGFTGPELILEAPWGGMLQTYAHTESIELQSSLTDLGEDFVILRTGMKPYPNCRGIHSPLEAILELKAQYGISSHHVGRVRVLGSQLTYLQVGGRSLGNQLEAQMSAPYALAIGLLDGAVTTKHYGREWLESLEVRSLMERIEVIVDSAVVGEPWVEITTTSGEVHRTRVSEARGGSVRPLSKNEIETKFWSLAGTALPSEHVERIAEIIEGLEDLQDVRELTSWLNPNATASMRTAIRPH